MNGILNKKDKLGKKEKKELEKQENLNVLFNLMALGNKSDRAISKILGISNTTFSRRRRILEQEGYIKEYTIMPDFHKLGFEFIVFTLASTTDAVTSAHSTDLYALMDKHPEVVCVLGDQGVSARSWFIISVHKNYDDYVETFDEIQKESMAMKHRPQHIELHTFILRTNKSIIKPFSLRNLEAILKSAKPSQLVRNGSADTPISTY